MVHLDTLSQLRLQRDVERLHALGPRATTEFVVNLTARIGGLPAALTLLAEYESRLTHAMLRSTRGDLPPRLLRLVPPT
jgi:hypothetical protein